MSTVNRVHIIGILGRDPEVRHTQNGNAVANLSVATSEKWKDKQTGEQRENTEWHKVTLFGRPAEVAGEYLKKGSKAYFEGKLQTRKWTDKEGIERYTTEILAHHLTMLTPKKDGAPNSAAKGRPEPQPQVEDDLDDDIPF